METWERPDDELVPEAWEEPNGEEMKTGVVVPSECDELEPDGKEYPKGDVEVTVWHPKLGRNDWKEPDGLAWSDVELDPTVGPKVDGEKLQAGVKDSSKGKEEPNAGLDAGWNLGKVENEENGSKTGAPKNVFSGRKLWDAEQNGLTGAEAGNLWHPLSPRW